MDNTTPNRCVSVGTRALSTARRMPTHSVSIPRHGRVDPLGQRADLDRRNWCHSYRRCLLLVSSVGFGFERGEAFDEAERETLDTFDVQAQAADVVEWSAQEVFPTQWHGEHLEEVLDEAYWG